jgi:hypothetical protein
MPGRDKVTPKGKDFFRQIAELAKLQVRVGFQQGAASEGGADIVDVAMWNELGTEHIPPRPFLRQSVENNAAQIKAMAEAQVKKLVKGQTTAQGALQALGTMQKGLIQNEIKSGGFTPNAPRTIAKKGSAQPLIDTGRLRQSVTFVIQEKGGGD